MGNFCGSVKSPKPRDDRKDEIITNNELKKIESFKNEPAKEKWHPYDERTSGDNLDKKLTKEFAQQNININIDLKIINNEKPKETPQRRESRSRLSGYSKEANSNAVNIRKNKLRNVLKEKQVENERRRSSVIIDSDVIVTKMMGSPFDYYSKERRLGEGSFGVVHLVRHNIILSNLRAMKEIQKLQSQVVKETEKEIMNEINILKKLDHPNIVKLFEFYSQPDAYYLVTEFCREGELFKQIISKKGFFDESFTAYIMYQIFSAVNYCHSMGIIHRDLKPENIMVERKERNGYLRVKVIDFGTAQVFEKGNIQKKVIGSSYYIAPEVLMKSYNEKCDMWSCGVIMYILLSSRPPFGGNDDNEIIRKIRIGSYDLSIEPLDRISNECRSLIVSLLTKDPSKRISAEEALNHSWFKLLKTKDKLNELKNNKFKYINNLKNYRREKVLQSAALAYLVHNFSQHEEVIEAYKLFNSMDINGDGRITQSELLIGLKQYLSLSEEALEADVVTIFSNMDADNNGCIECQEFVIAAIDKEKLITDDILQFAFNYFDIDGSGEIESQEIYEIFFNSTTNKNLPDVKQQLEYIISEVDINEDGKICYEEFSQMMKNIIKED